MCVSMCALVCVREREREGGRERGMGNKGTLFSDYFIFCPYASFIPKLPLCHSHWPLAREAEIWLVSER